MENRDVSREHLQGLLERDRRRRRKILACVLLALLLVVAVVTVYFFALRGDSVKEMTPEEYRAAARIHFKNLIDSMNEVQDAWELAIDSGMPFSVSCANLVLQAETLQKQVESTSQTFSGMKPPAELQDTARAIEDFLARSGTLAAEMAAVYAYEAEYYAIAEDWNDVDIAGDLAGGKDTVGFTEQEIASLDGLIARLEALVPPERVQPAQDAFVDVLTRLREIFTLWKYAMNEHDAAGLENAMYELGSYGNYYDQRMDVGHASFQTINEDFWDLVEEGEELLTTLQD